MKVTEAIAGIVGAKIESMGYELYDVEYVKEFGEMNLVITIDAPAGVALDDCERVSHAVEPLIDAADPIDEAYYLIVSSVGLDHPIRRNRDFQRNLGQIVEVKLYVAIDKKKQLKGKLVSFDEESFVIEPDKGGERRILRKDAALIRPWIDF